MLQSDISTVELVLLSVHLDAVVLGLPPAGVCNLRTVSRGICHSMATCVEHTCANCWRALVADSHARKHYSMLFGTIRPMDLIMRRRWLIEKIDASETLRWGMTQGNRCSLQQATVIRLVHGADLDHGDLFASLRRAYLASQVPAFAQMEGVIAWMHVLGSVEEQDSFHAKLLAKEAWSCMAQAVTEETVIWAVQTAHFLDDVAGLRGWFEDSDLELSELGRWLTTLQRSLEATPALGKYGPVGESSQVRPRHLSRVIAELT